MQAFKAFKALWRSVAIEHLDEKKIDEYLHKHGIESMKDLPAQRGLGAAQVPKRKVRKRPTMVHNEHLKQSGLLVDYGNDDWLTLPCLFLLYRFRVIFAALYFVIWVLWRK